MGRYSGVDVATYEFTDAQGTRQVVRYYRRRFPPNADRPTVLARHRVVPDDRLDLLSARYVGDPLAFWRICDANGALDPDDLTDASATGSDLTITAPGVP